ncbi:MAG: hypothetical protein ABIS68_11255, partial [Casimicrobiaceae bacterium]
MSIVATTTRQQDSRCRGSQFQDIVSLYTRQFGFDIRSTGRLESATITNRFAYVGRINAAAVRQISDRSRHL